MTTTVQPDNRYEYHYYPVKDRDERITEWRGFVLDRVTGKAVYVGTHQSAAGVSAACIKEWHYLKAQQTDLSR